MKTIICEKNEAVRQAAEIVCGLLKEKPDAVLALACGETMAPLWAELSRACHEGACSLKDARIRCVTELCGVSEEKSCSHALNRGLIETTDARKENCFCPETAQRGKECIIRAEIQPRREESRALSRSKTQKRTHPAGIKTRQTVFFYNFLLDFPVSYGIL